MRIKPIVNSGTDFTAWAGVYLSARRADHPGWPIWSERELRVLYGDSAHRSTKLWLAETPDGVVGAAVLGLPLRDNLTLGWPEVFVRPGARRQGVGSALLDAAEDAARECGRNRLMTHVEGSCPGLATPATAFAERHGFTRRLVMTIRVQRSPFDLAAIDVAEEAALPRANGYKIVAWRDRVPDEYVDEFARLEQQLSLDEPRGDMDYETEVWDAARVRTIEDEHVRMGRSRWITVAVAPDGTFAGSTVLSMAEARHEIGRQLTTVVIPAHRGRRLGTLLKTANIRALLLDRPGALGVSTWNAESNRHMIAINEALGYRVEGWAASYQRDS